LFERPLVISCPVIAGAGRAAKKKAFRQAKIRLAGTLYERALFR
jgi:hypothetical protein